MAALIVGIVCIILAFFASFGLGWWPDVLVVLRGALPLLAGLVGILALFIGIADLKDRQEATKEAPKAE